MAFHFGKVSWTKHNTTTTISSSPPLLPLRLAQETHKENGHGIGPAACAAGCDADSLSHLHSIFLDQGILALFSVFLFFSLSHTVGFSFCVCFAVSLFAFPFLRCFCSPLLFQCVCFVCSHVELCCCLTSFACVFRDYPGACGHQDGRSSAWSES